MANQVRIDDETLLRWAQTDPGAVDVLYRRHVDAVYAFVYRRCGDVELAADIAAETFAAAILAAHSYRPEAGPARGWLCGIARHKTIDAQRRDGAERRARERLGFRQATVHHDDLDALESRLDALDYGRDVTKLVEDLPLGEREAVTAVILGDVDPVEVAQRLGLSIPTLQKRIRRGVRRIAKQVEER